MNAVIDIATPLLECIRELDDRVCPMTCEIPSSVLKLASRITEAAAQQPDTLAESLHHSLHDLAGRINRVSLAVTGLAWLGAGVQSVQQEIISIVRSARREISLCAYSITSGAGGLIDEIIEASNQGVTVTLVINDLQSQPLDTQTRIRMLTPALRDRIRIFDFTSGNTQSQLHAKVVVADRSTALVGSANLSFHGLYSNHELALVVRGPLAEEVAARMDLLAKAARPVKAANLPGSPVP